MGEDGSARRGDECSDEEDPTAASLVDTVTIGETFDAAGGADWATTDDCFKPKCLVIQSSIHERIGAADRRAVLQTSDILMPHNA